MRVRLATATTESEDSDDGMPDAGTGPGLHEDVSHLGSDALGSQVVLLKQLIPV